ncbi:MAG TPA: DUF3108 domain-containing protein [Paenirhodobacter sp.]
MPFPRPPVPRLAICAALIIAALCRPAQADQSDRIVFDFQLAGLSAGQLTIDGTIAGNAYNANGVMKTTGILGALRTLRYDSTVSGGYAQGRFTPLRMDEIAQRGSDRIEHAIVYRGNVPVSVTRNPPRKARATDVAAVDQGGTIDPLTALYAVLRDVDRAEACRFSSYLFDGSKRAQVVLSQPVAAGQGVTCTGEYRRIAGFSKSDMAEKPRFPFRLTYAPTPDGQRLRVVSIDTDTILGKGRLIRR